MSYQSYIEIVSGNTTSKIFLFTLSTCAWCKKTKQLLKDMGVGYKFLDVDLLEYEERDAAYIELEKYNPSLSFPTIIVDGKVAIIGFNEEKIKQLVK